jgi:hypothetical protein
MLFLRGTFAIRVVNSPHEAGAQQLRIHNY